MTVKIEILGEDANHALRELLDLSTGLVVKSATVTLAASTALSTSADVAPTPAPVERVETSSAPRERGKPAPGRARRTKEEITEDEAAEAAGSQISTNPESRVAPDDTPEDQAQDAADEQAEVEAHREQEAPLTIDDVRNAVGAYVNKFTMAAVQEDGPVLFSDILGKPPEGERFWKMSILPTDPASLKKVVDAWHAAAAASTRYKTKA